MMTAEDLEWVRGNSAEIIGGTGAAITRKRLDTTMPPASYNEEYGEVTDKSEETYTELVLTAKVFWDPSEQFLAKEFGGEIEAAAVVHVKIDDDVAAGDFLVIEGTWYEVFKTVIAALHGHKACAVRKAGERGENTVPGVIDGGAPDTEFYTGPYDGGGA